MGLTVFSCIRSLGCVWWADRVGDSLYGWCAGLGWVAMVGRLLLLRMFSNIMQAIYHRGYHHGSLGSHLHLCCSKEL